MSRWPRKLTLEVSGREAGAWGEGLDGRLRIEVYHMVEGKGF